MRCEEYAVRCVVTGAGGFVGRSLVPALRSCGYEVDGWQRGADFDLAAAAHAGCAPAAWSEKLRGVDVVVHLAGLAHQPRDSRADAAPYFAVNRDGTVLLARAAIAAGVRRLIYISTAKVFGEGADGPYSHASVPRPQDAYGQSKREAELALQQLARDAGLEVVIVRPPLVYGPDAPANFGMLLRLAQLPLPFPFAGIDNRRSMIGIDNLIDLIRHCIESPQAPGVWECADREPYSIGDVIAQIRAARGRRPCLFAVPASLRERVKAWSGRWIAARVFGDFVLDTTHTSQALGWQAPFEMREILQRAGAR